MATLYSDEPSWKKSWKSLSRFWEKLLINKVTTNGRDFIGPGFRRSKNRILTLETAFILYAHAYVCTLGLVNSSKNVTVFGTRFQSLPIWKNRAKSPHVRQTIRISTTSGELGKGPFWKRRMKRSYRHLIHCDLIDNSYENILLLLLLEI